MGAPQVKACLTVVTHHCVDETNSQFLSNALISNPLLITGVTSESLQSRSTQLHIRDTLKRRHH